jgi:hypothetical protein
MTDVKIDFQFDPELHAVALNVNPELLNVPVTKAGAPDEPISWSLTPGSAPGARLHIVAADDPKTWPGQPPQQDGDRFVGTVHNNLTSKDTAQAHGYSIVVSMPVDGFTWTFRVDPEVQNDPPPPPGPVDS